MTCIPHLILVCRGRLQDDTDKLAPFICKIQNQPLKQLHYSVHETLKESSWFVYTFTEMEKGCKLHFLKLQMTLYFSFLPYRSLLADFGTCLLAPNEAERIGLIS